MFQVVQQRRDEPMVRNRLGVEVIYPPEFALALESSARQIGAADDCANSIFRNKEREFWMEDRATTLCRHSPSGNERLGLRK